jgi:hypothetical protein
VCGRERCAGHLWEGAKVTSLMTIRSKPMTEDDHTKTVRPHQMLIVYVNVIKRDCFHSSSARGLS